jgi:hypothetical protein
MERLGTCEKCWISSENDCINISFGQKTDSHVNNVTRLPFYRCDEFDICLYATGSGNRE